MENKKFKTTNLGNFPLNWKESVIGEYFDVKAGGDLNRISFSKENNNDFKYPIYSNSHSNKGLYGYSKEYQYEPECITITARGNVGTAICRSERFNAIVRLLVLKPRKQISCYFISEFINNNLNFSHVGAAQNQLTAPMISDEKIIFPNNYNEQLKIASVLSNYDNLIENNTRRIHILEEMAQRIYKEWFVDFKYPGHENDELVDSELGMIPEGWEVKNLKYFGEVITGSTPSKKVHDYYGDHIPFIKTPDMHENVFCIETSERLSLPGAESQIKKMLPSGSLCVSCIGTTGVGVVCITTQSSQTNQQINSIITHKSDIREYLYFSLLGLKETIKNYGATGVTMINLSKGKFQSLLVIKPPQSIISKYHEISCSLLDQIKTIQYLNINLRQTRDLLLPKLISGKVDVSDLDIDTSILND